MNGLTLEVSLLEAAHLGDLVVQFRELLRHAQTEDPLADPAIARLVPDAYREDPASAAEFRALTQNDLFESRQQDAEDVISSLRRSGAPLAPDEVTETQARTEIAILLDAQDAAAWLRTLAALRLVLAVRLGVTDDDTELDDPRFGVYNWLGYRLEGLIDALDA